MVGPMGTFEKAMDITRAGLAAVEGGRLVRESLVRSGRDLTIRGKRFDLGRFERVFLIAAGKAAGPMAAGFMAVLGDEVDEGIVTCRPEENPAPDRLTAVPAAHPLPTRKASGPAGRPFVLPGKPAKMTPSFSSSRAARRRLSASRRRASGWRTSGSSRSASSKPGPTSVS